MARASESPDPRDVPPSKPGDVNKKEVQYPIGDPVSHWVPLPLGLFRESSIGFHAYMELASLCLEMAGAHSTQHSPDSPGKTWVPESFLLKEGPGCLWSASGL